MNVILGASGRVGSAVVSYLREKGRPVKAVIRNEKNTSRLQAAGAAVALADIHDEFALTRSFKDATAILVLTPESGKEQDLLADTRAILQNYRSAVEKSSAKKIVGISSIGAQHKSGTGNLQMSYMLEHAFDDLPVERIFVRPAYYFSNWLPSADTVKMEGVLPTFFPLDLSIPMIAPEDVAEVIAGLMMEYNRENRQTVYEIEGPASYTSADVANMFSEVLNKKVIATHIDRAEWESMLKPLGFSQDGIKNFIEMTEAVINGKASAERTNTIAIKTQTSLKAYLQREIGFQLDKSTSR